MGKHRISSRSQRGAGRLPLLFLLALTAAIVYLMAIFMPLNQANQQMYAATAEIVHRGATMNLTDRDVEAQLREKAREFGLPEDANIKLQREGRKLLARISYTRQVNFPLFTYHVPFDINVQDLGL